MLQTKARPFTDAERERLEAELIQATTDRKRDHGSAIFSALAGAVFGLITGGFVALFLSIWELPGLWAALVAVGCTLIGLVLGYYRGAKEDRRSDEQSKQYRKEHAVTLATRLGRGEIEETTVAASAVAHVTDGDEVDGYFFDIGDNRVLFLWSMDMWDDASDETPLSTAFTFTRFNDDSGNLYSFADTGEPLASVRELTFTGDWNETLYSGAVFESTSLPTLETDLPYLTAAPDETGAA